MPDSKINKFNKYHIAKSFNKISANYDDVSILQEEVAQRLVERLNYINLNPNIIVELGAGTGYCTQLIQNRYPKANIIAIDIADKMLHYVNQRSLNNVDTICADAYQLPLNDNSVDLIISNMMLPWCDELVSLFQECHRVLSPEKLLLFATVGPDTLKELRLSWAEVDNYQHVNSFIDMHDIGDALIQAQFQDPVMDVENIQLIYPNPGLILKDLKMMGSQNLNTNKRCSLMNQTNISKLKSSYSKYQIDSDQYPVSCEIIYGHAWGVNFDQNEFAMHEGSASIPLQQLKRLIRRPN